MVVDASGARQVLWPAAAPPRRGARPRRADRLRRRGAARGRRPRQRRPPAVHGLAPRHGRPGWPTFLYAVPLDAERVLLEETSLARRPGLPMPELRARLRARCSRPGSPTRRSRDDPADAEQVRFPVDRPGTAPPPASWPSGPRPRSSTLRRGSAWRPRCAWPRGSPRPRRRAAGGADPAAAAKAARRVVRSPAAGDRARAAPPGPRDPARDAARRRPGVLRPLLRPPGVHRRAYLDARDDVAASLAAMLALFGRLTPRSRRHLIRGSLLGAGSVRTEQ